MAVLQRRRRRPTLSIHPDAAEGIMQVLDFARSSVTWRIDLDELPPRTLSHQPPYPMNNSRITLESRCTIVEDETGRTHTFVLGASCKTEQVGAERDLFLLPNADFMPILSEREFMHIKTFSRAGQTRPRYTGETGSRTAGPDDGAEDDDGPRDRAGRDAGRDAGPAPEDQPDRLRVPIRGTFVKVHLDLVSHEAERLRDAEDIVNATFSGDPMVVHTTIRRGRYTATVEFPVKTMNANEREWIYQTDTGPVLYPDLDAPPDELMDRLDVAFAAHNAPDWIEFIVRRRTSIGEGLDVFHYSEPVRLNGVENAVYRILQGAPATTRRVELGV
jgi:hypothetical protein